MSYAISIPTLDDTYELAVMLNQSWIETYPNEAAGVSLEYIKGRSDRRLGSNALEKRRSAIQQSYDDPDYFMRIAKDETGSIVGSIYGYKKDDTYELDGLYTLQRTHGTGLGLQLWTVFKDWVGDVTIDLSVVTYNARAKAFYTKLGFIDVAGSERLLGDSIIPVVDMVRQL